MIKKIIFSIVSVFLLHATITPPARASEVWQIETEENPRVEISLESFLDEMPPSGFAPVLVKLRNQTDAPQTFRLDYKSDGSSFRCAAQGSATIGVDARGRSQTLVYVPVLQRPNWGNIAVNISGPGIRDGHACIRTDRSPNSNRFIGMSDTFAAKYWSGIDNALKKLSGSSYGNELCGSKFSPAACPPDWRAYSGFTSLWMSADEWNELDPGARTAICEWLGFGGKLFLVANDKTQRAAVQIPGAVQDSAGKQALGLGTITFVSDGKNGPFANDFIGFVKAVADEENIAEQLYGSRRSGSDSAYAQKKWELKNIVGALSQNVVPLAIFMVVFALAVGPLNFFVLAPSKRRYRILWTTPLIAVAASIMLGAFILLSDGTGGTGARMTFACLLPEQKRLLIQQEQISQTGLLLGTDFDFAGDTQLLPIEFGAGRDENSFRKTENGWGGDWFSSRATQAQFARNVRAIRGGIHVTLPENASGNAGVIVALDMPLKEFFVLSPDGKSAYRAENLTPGVRANLVKINISELDSAWKTMSAPAGEIIRNASKKCALRAGWFYATAKNPADNASATLSSIDWKTDIALVAGPAEFDSEK